jgi:pimeloyl-ACP methyl ester carboxylesterase
MHVERVILIPGLGADERLFGSQRTAGLTFEVPTLPIPKRSEDMTHYALRLCDRLRLDGPCVLGGVSFGGMLACEMAAHCDARAVVLIAACRDRAAIPRYYYGAELISRLLPDVLIRRRCATSSRLLAGIENLDAEQFELIHDMAQRISVPFLRRTARMILGWRGSPQLSCPVHHVHGRLDRVIPVRQLRPDVIIEQGGHLINMTHAGQVNQFIADSLSHHFCAQAAHA